MFVLWCCHSGLPVVFYCLAGTNTIDCTDLICHSVCLRSKMAFCLLFRGPPPRPIHWGTTNLLPNSSLACKLTTLMLVTWCNNLNYPQGTVWRHLACHLAGTSALLVLASHQCMHTNPELRKPVCYSCAALLRYSLAVGQFEMHERNHLVVYTLIAMNELTASTP